MREVVAKRIIEMAQRGVRDKEQLAADAVKFISANYVENYSAKIESQKNWPFSSLLMARLPACLGLLNHSRDFGRTCWQCLRYIGELFAMK